MATLKLHQRILLHDQGSYTFCNRSGFYDRQKQKNTNKLITLVKKFAIYRGYMAEEERKRTINPAFS